MNQTDILFSRYRTILSYTGLILLLEGAVTLSPLLFLPFYPEELPLAPGFLIPAAALALLGLALRRVFHPRTYVVLTMREGGVIVLISWIAAFLSAAAPFMLILDFTFTQAVFESVSGWTTTGLSVVDVTRAPNLILLWRSIVQFAGGAGFAIIMLASLAGPAGTGFSTAEGRTDQLVPHVRASARLVMMIYSGYALAGIIAYLLAGMTPFDSLNHTFAAISTGGFSTRVESIGYWNSFAVEAVSIVLMIFGNLNFLTAYTLLNGKFRAFSRNGEIRLISLVIPFCTLALFLLTTPALYPHLDKAFRVALFETVTAITTTGFSTVAYTDWNGAGVFVLLLLMLIGGGSGSTAGGIKQFRVYLLYREFIWEIRRAFLPRNTVTEHFVWQGENRDYITDSRIRQIAMFLFCYLAVYAAGTFVLTAYGYSLRDSLFEFASSLGTVGITIGVTAPDAPRGVLWTEIAGMVLGRLEFFIIFIGVGKLLGDLGRFVATLTGSGPNR